jgi:rubredoxin
VAETGTFNREAPESPAMSMERTHYCPNCEAETAFYRTASTTLHLGEKVKWHCPDCSNGVVTIGGAIETVAET